MDKLTKAHLISFYDTLLQNHGDRPEALRWTRQGQLLRYNLFAQIASDLNGATVLDYGCGKGDFYSFLKDKNINIKYTGLDINPALISLARDKHPEADFEVFDVEEADLEGTFDYVFVCGVFNNRVEGAQDTMLSVVTRLFRNTNSALAFNAVSTYATHKDIDINYVKPEDVLEYVLSTLTPYVALRHDSMSDDFTLFLYKNPNRS